MCIATARQEEKERKRDDIETVAIPAIPTTPLSPSPAQPAGAVYYGNIALGADQTVTALEVRRLKEQELRNNDLYWQRRLQQQEQQLKQTNAILEKEYNETVCAMPVVTTSRSKTNRIIVSFAVLLSVQ